MIVEYRGKRPKIAGSAFIAPTAVLIGDVEVGEESSIWFGTVVRGDNGPIRIGSRTSVQDNAVVHVSDGGGTYIGDDVTIGHSAVMEDCRIERYALIGSNATLSTAARSAKVRSLQRAASSLRKRRFRARVVAAGAPAKVKKPLEGNAASWIEVAAEEYVKLSRMYLAQSIGTLEDQDVKL